MRPFLMYIIIISGNISFGQDFWIQKDSIKGPPRSGIATFVLGNRGYAVGGLLGNESTRKVYSYSINQDDWDDETALGGVQGGGLERNLSCGFSLNNKGYVATGQGLGTPFMKDVWEYDKAAQTWTQKADFPGTPRRGAAVFVIHDNAYLGTGEDANGLCNDVYRYDATGNQWYPVASFPGGARRQAAAFELNGYGWIATGDAGTLKKDLWSYNSITDEWQQKADLPGSARIGAVAWSTSPSAYVATGQSPEGEYLSDVWQYNYYLNAWVQKNPFSGGGRTNASAFVINGIPFVGAGYNGQFLDDFYAYQGLAEVQGISSVFQVYPNPTQGTLRMVGVNEPCHYHIVSIEGRILMEGDLHSDDTISIAEFPTGSYLIRFIFSNQTLVKWVQKQ